jgi:hypothetical protein
MSVSCQEPTYAAQQIASSITPPGQMACDALTAVARCFVLSLDSEQVVTKKAVRLHCHSVPRSGSDTACGRPTATAAPAATIAAAAIASVLDLCQMNLMAFSDLRGLKSALCRHDSLRASSPRRNRTTETSLHRTSAPLAPVTMSDSGPCRVLTSAPSARSTAGLRITRSPRFTPALNKTSRPRVTYHADLAQMHHAILRSVWLFKKSNGSNSPLQENILSHPFTIALQSTSNGIVCYDDYNIKIIPTCRNREKNKMKPTSKKFTASAPAERPKIIGRHHFFFFSLR